jgi:hypothetical protein
MKFDKLVESILNEEQHKMTPQQEHVYSIYRSADWEFSHWEDDGSIVMTRWDRGSDSAIRLAELIIKPDGEHERVKFKSLSK